MGRMGIYWLSIAPERGKSRVVLTEAASAKEATDKCMRFVLPGGETCVIEVPAEEPEAQLPRDRVLSDEELRGVGAVLLGDIHPELS